MRAKRPVFTELTDDLLDLAVEEKGYRHALYAQTVNPGCTCSGSSSSLTCCKLSWN
jgi:hypothetical protein